MENQIPQYDLCLIKCNIKKGETTILELVRVGVKISEKEVAIANAPVAQRDNGMSKFYVPTGKVKEGDIIKCKEVGEFPNAILELVFEEEAKEEVEVPEVKVEEIPTI